MNRTIIVLTLVVGAAGCQKEAAPAAGPAPAAAPAKQAVAVKAPAAPSAGKVARVVFVDKAEACECTQGRIDASWKALNDALGPGTPIKLERIHMDTEPDRAAPYRAKKAVMVPPALYFLGQDGALREVLQGEVKVAQVKKILGG